jgi:hypothetical protein
MDVSRQHNAGQDRNLLIASKLFENAENFKYLGKTGIDHEVISVGF